jgi:hypothetical protein
MDAKSFRELLEVAKEFKVDNFSLAGDAGTLSVEFSRASYYNKDEVPNLAPVTEQDADELMLAHIEKLKAQATIGLKEV